MVYVFKTSVETEKTVKKLKPNIDRLTPNMRWNFDLEDCDNILRIESSEITPKQVIDLLKTYNFECEELV